VTSRSVTGFESGEIDAAPATLAAIARELRFPPAFFEAAEMTEIPQASASFRALSKITAAQRNAALAAGALALALDGWLSERFTRPPVTVPKLGPNIDPELAAEVVRTEWRLGSRPIPNMVHLLEAHGVRVFSLAEECAEVDAFSTRSHEIPFVFLNTQKTAEHSRMDAAHELGHLVLHAHHEIPQGREAEKEAQRFASAFLMPRSELLATAPRYPTLSTILRLRQQWLVSAAAYVYRLHQLGLLTDWQNRTLIIEMTKAGYRKSEPGGMKKRETSQALTKMFGMLRKDGIGNEAIAAAMDVYPDDLQAIVFNLALLPLAGSGSTTARVRPDLEVIAGGGN
jgi:Zn-dependent peptidase ImmA (M78 family)